MFLNLVKCQNKHFIVVIRQQMNKLDLQNEIENPQFCLTHQQSKLIETQFIQDPQTLLQHINKRKLNPIKIMYEHQETYQPNQREYQTKMQAKKRGFDKRRLNTNRLKIQFANKRSSQDTFVEKTQERDSLSLQSSKQKCSRGNKNVFLEQFVSSPNQRLQSLKHHLKTVRQQNQTYLKNKMNVIKQKIMRKRQKVVTQSNKPTFWQRQENRMSEKTNQKQSRRLTVQKYNDKLQYSLIRKSIQIQKCQVLNFQSHVRGGTNVQYDEQRAENKSKNTLKKPQSNKTINLYQEHQQLNVKGTNKKGIKKDENNHQSYKMMLVNRLNPLKNVITVIKPERQLEKNKFNTDHSQVQHFFKIKTFNQTLGPQKSAHKYSKSFDISLIKRIEKKLSEQTAAHNFIRGSLIYRLLKQRSNSRKSETTKLEAQGFQNQPQDDKNDFLASLLIQQQSQLVQNVEVMEKSISKKKKKVVLSNKNISLYKNQQQAEDRQPQPFAKLDQNKQSVRSMLYFEQQQGK